MNYGREDRSFNINTVSHADESGLTLLADTALNDEADVSRTPILDPNLEGMSTHDPRQNVNVPNGRLNNNEPNETTHNESTQPDIEESSERLDVFFVHPMPENPPIVFPHTPPNSKSSLIKSLDPNTSCVPSRLFESILNNTTSIESNVRDSKHDQIDNDVPMNYDSDPIEVPTSGTIPYHGLPRADSKTTISFEGLTKSEAESFLLTEPAKYNDYHSVYIPNIIHTIKLYCFCQDELITNDWNIHLFHDGYPGHPVISGGVRLPTSGPRSGRTWQERVREIIDHCAHSRHLIHLVETILSTRMLAEASMRAGTIKCDNSLHIKGGLMHSTYAGRYEDVNLFFSVSETKRLNSYSAIAEAHGEPELASKILDTLLMLFPDEDTISALTESRLLDVGTVHDILRFAFD
ncbi:hypothetical protein DEU56DRAFT_912053 [Suillus clintonianus]|uniref:uncharacterized protein n=1 Tax=Suillus clintonianus TaxID=1904413 RepID=UPI001B86F462|nr:uncharacterized protein DEU56DRAFT_912053 [Suillus clintonianus]KAG2139787.1 hypothetical protein DEU56DRAFT_912053 [Suillus clintonianus]